METLRKHQEDFLKGRPLRRKPKKLEEQLTTLSAAKNFILKEYWRNVYLPQLMH